MKHIMNWNSQLKKKTFIIKFEVSAIKKIIKQVTASLPFNIINTQKKLPETY